MSVRGRLYDWAFARRPDIRNPLQRLVCAEHRHRFPYVADTEERAERVLFLAPTFEQARFWARVGLLQAN